MTDEQKKKPGVAFWATVVVVAALVAIVSYPLSLGPALWLRNRGVISVMHFEALLTPLLDLIKMLPDPVRASLFGALDWYILRWQ